MPVRLDRLVFFGTPEFALPTLQALVAAGRAPALVVTQPPRPAGRGRRLAEPPVMRWAREAGLATASPERVREPAFLDGLLELAPDLAVVVAFGQIFPPELLAIPRRGCVNVHASLLPRHRGAAPVQAAILAGDGVTGVTTMQMDAGLDTGPMLVTATTRLGGRETAGELAPRLAHLGAATLLETLDRLEADTLQPCPQPEEGATYAPRLDRSVGEVDWAASASEIFARLRAVTPWPGLHTTRAGERLKILWAEPLDGPGSEAASGTLIGLRDGRAVVACGEGALGLEKVQRAGRQAVDAASWWHGERPAPGERLGT